MSGRPFLTARWRHLLLLNYRVDPGLLEPLVPSGTELDAWEGQIHVWQIFANRLDEGENAIQKIGAFVRRHTS